MLDPGMPIDGLCDSKCLRAGERERLARAVRERALAWSVAWADVAEIDRLNILQATLLAMRRAVEGLRVRPSRVQIDGNTCPRLEGLEASTEAIVGGDRRRAAISAASIIAKVERDAIMARMDAIWPAYGFVRHKGYATAVHLAALTRRGPCPIHRVSFAPVRAARRPARAVRG